MLPRYLTWPLTAILSFALPVGAYALLTREPTHGPIELGKGVSYAVEDLAPAANGSGRIYWGKFPLDRSALDLFITPPDPALAGTRWTHRLTRTADTGEKYGLALTINGGLFGNEPWPPGLGVISVRNHQLQLRREGARSVTSETTVVTGTVVNWWEHTYNLEFADDLTPTAVPTKPPAATEVLQRFRWAIGAQGWTLYDNLWFNVEDFPVGRYTAVGLDMPNRVLYLAVVERASRYRLATELKLRGATHVFMLDGSESSTFAVNGRAITGDWRPVANHVGVKLNRSPAP